MNTCKILIIEDNDEVRDLIKVCLEADYTILEAANGKEGWEIAVEELPDLIITDVMMPEMDGNEFCRNLKNDERTSHIPVIMLTAKVSVEQQVEGLESGADVYLTKPFSIQVLQSYIKNLLKIRETHRLLYSQKIFLEPSGVEIGTVDKKFMERLMSIAEANLSNPDFHINELSREIGMSKPVLYKKFNALAKIPIGEFIKSLRLKKAALLLTHDKMNIAEVAWEVGFSDRKYFSKEFKKFFGKSPSEYVTGSEFSE
ncbi:response regulator [Chitinophagaceae bacterium LB-8]|uniref:Response regulator n=1 Tax=Paraflavisolibacter caeni TaxID=2982496 RepID=A0A9X2XV44_9BACT|nr:response regulator [Paraflavisolibacter caeni]MCU7549250.1 response regulator [Paraflavisolibacter caeni]